jgi:hypothetical protein
MERSAPDANTRAVSPKPSSYKILVMGNIPANDKDFLAWREEHRPGIGTRDAMSEYVRLLNGKSKELLDEQLEKLQAYCRSAMSTEQQKELEGIRMKIAEHKIGN